MQMGIFVDTFCTRIWMTDWGDFEGVASESHPHKVAFVLVVHTCGRIRNDCYGFPRLFDRFLTNSEMCFSCFFLVLFFFRLVQIYSQTFYHQEQRIMATVKQLPQQENEKCLVKSHTISNPSWSPQNRCCVTPPPLTQQLLQGGHTKSNLMQHWKTQSTTQCR